LNDTVLYFRDTLAIEGYVACRTCRTFKSGNLKTVWNDYNALVIDQSVFGKAGLTVVINLDVAIGNTRDQGAFTIDCDLVICVALGAGLSGDSFAVVNYKDTSVVDKLITSNTAGTSVINLS
jgi:hypothetical protein